MKAQKGFAVAEVLLILVIIGIIVGVSYFVYNSQKETTSSLENAVNANNTIATNNKIENKTDPYYGWKSYSKNGLEFKYPADWILEEQAFAGVSSQDFKSTGIQATTIISGISVGFDKTDIPQTNITADNYNSSDILSQTYSNFEKKSISDKVVVQYNISDNIIRTVFFKNDGLRIGAQAYFAAENKDANLNNYNLILASVKY